MHSLLRKRFRAEDFPLPDYGLVYLEHLKGEFKGLCPRQGVSDKDCDPYAIARSIVQKAETWKNLTWGDLYALGKAILDLQPVEMVRERAWSIEARYRDAVGRSTAFDAWLKQNPITDEKSLRARTENLIRELYRLYTVATCRETLRDHLSRMTSMLVLAFGGLTVGVAIFRADWLWTVGLVAYSGAIGGFVSFQRRIQSLPSHGESLSDLVQLESSTGIYLSPVSGAIFATVLYLLFAAKAIEGGLFPAISTVTTVSTAGMRFIDFAINTGAATGFDWSKLLVWSFIAGFAERFVPDTLDRLIAKQQSKKAE